MIYYESTCESLKAHPTSLGMLEEKLAHACMPIERLHALRHAHEELCASQVRGTRGSEQAVPALGKPEKKLQLTLWIAGLYQGWT